MTELDKERTERAGDPRITAAYRELGTEEPSSAVDAAILAAARRRPQRWYAPLAAAAVIALAVGVTLHLQIEQPDLEAPALRAEKPVQPAAQPPAKEVADSVAKAAPARVRPKAEAPAKAAEPRAFAPAPQSPSAPSSTPAPAASAAGALAGPSAERDMRADRAREISASPERELERVAALRAQGRQEEADRALADFRRRFPDYKIPEEIRLRIERR